MFSSSSSDKPTGLFAGISNDSCANLFQVPLTTNSNVPGPGLFGNLKTTTEIRTNIKESEPSSSSAHTIGKNSIASKTVFHSPRSGDGFEKDRNDRCVIDTNMNGNEHNSYFDVPVSSNNEKECLDSNNIQNAANLYWPAVKLSRLPIEYNTKSFLLKHFQSFGPVERIICQPSMDAAYIAFNSLSSANRAKRSGRECIASANIDLPSSVLFTMARCRRQTNSGSTPISPKLGPIKGKNIVSSMSPSRTSLKRTITSQSNIKQVMNKKQFSSVSVSSDNQLSSVSSQIPCYNTQPTVSSSITRSNVSAYNTNGLFNQKSSSATTLDERLFVLQENYRRDCELRSISESVDPKIQYSDICNNNTDEPIRHAPIKGTCEDMCPELERYCRAAHQRVSIFECLPTTMSANSSSWEMDHTRAVKDYQRSSADQPVPLPRELRPTSVLQRTMAYLLASIADRPEIDTSRSLWKPWYEFMWTRTRAIRKDIRQQNLCCPIVIGVIERIARFHIFCAARLVDQPVDTFDPRINSENLTQCLQTLKEMYSDLDSSITSENICPNEAEFRGYMLLMKLNDQNEINEAQRLPERLRQSKPVRFAFATHEALITNNYIRFFRLARQATCLVACLMHRYFVQIRSQALMKLSCAFAGHPKREVHYPLSTLTQQLGFENETESKDFCETWGLSVFDSNVIFEKQIQPQPPTLPWKEQRSFHLVENKRIGIPLSVLFNGSPINPSDAIPSPVQSSFDINGKYICSQKKHTQNDNDTLDYNNRIPDSNICNNNWNTPFMYQQPTTNSTLATTNSWLTERNIYNKKQISNELLEIVYNECVDEVLSYSTFSQTVLLEEMIINELIEKLIIDFIEDHLIDLFNNRLDPIRQIDKEIMENITNETLNLYLYSLVHREWTLELLYNEYVDQLINEQLHKLATSSLTISIANSLYNYSLLKCCFNHFHYLIWKHNKLIQKENLLNTMPTSISSDCLPLCLMMNNNEWNTNEDISTINVLKHSSYTRISLEMLKLDDQLTWSPMKPSSIFYKYPLGLYKSILMPTHTYSKTIQQQFTNIFHWIYNKLKHLPIVLLNEWPTTSVISNQLSGIIVIGYFDHSITKEQLMSMHSTNLVQSYDQDFIKDLLILAVTCSLQEIPCSSLEDIHHNNNDDDIYLVHLSNSISFEQKFQPNPFWSMNLQYGLSWIEDCFMKKMNRLNHHTFQNGSNANPKYALSSTTSSSSPSNTEMTTLYRKLHSLIDEYIDITLLRPLANLSEIWKLHGLVDPSLKSLIDKYHSIILNLIDQLIPMDKFFTNLLHNSLILSENILNLILIDYNNSNNNNNNNSNSACSSSGDYCRFQAQIKANNNNNNSNNDNSNGNNNEKNPNTLSISWNTYINHWLILSKQLKFNSSIHNWIMISFYKIEKDFIDSLNKIKTLTNDQFYNALPSINLAPNLNLFYGLIKNYEPCMTRSNAIHLSLHNVHRNNIETCLQSIRRRKSSTSIEHKESLSAKLNELSFKIQKIENSMNDTIKETKKYKLNTSI
uniref:SAC3_GANP domain-containing protein n=1 Tax=Schistosoma mansoni TaxID=6183 RepID=A0A3Q0KU01_SCHMA